MMNEWVTTYFLYSWLKNAVIKIKNNKKRAIPISIGDGAYFLNYWLRKISIFKKDEFYSKLGSGTKLTSVVLGYKNKPQKVIKDGFTKRVA